MARVSRRQLNLTYNAQTADVLACTLGKSALANFDRATIRGPEAGLHRAVSIHASCVTGLDQYPVATRPKQCEQTELDPGVCNFPQRRIL